DRAKNLHREIAEAAQSDDDSRGSRVQVLGTGANRVIRGQRGIGQCRGDSGIELTDCNECPLGHAYIFGHAAILRDTRRVRWREPAAGAPAGILPARETRAARAARPARMNDDAIASPPLCDTVAATLDDAANLVTQRRAVRRTRIGRMADMQVRLAQA